MQFTVTAAVMAGVAAASWSPDMGSHGGWGEHGAAPPSNGTGAPAYTTEVVTAFTTYCPEATQLTHGGQTYTVSEATTLTITDCPGGCTVTMPVSSAPPATSAVETITSSSAVETIISSSAVEVAPTGYTSEAPPASSTPVAPAPVYPTAGNGTAPAPAPSGTGSYTSATEGSPVPAQTGNSASTLSAGAAGILAVFGLVAAL